MEIVKPAGIWVASISSRERRNYTPQAGFEEKLRAKINAVEPAEDLVLEKKVPG